MSDRLRKDRTHLRETGTVRGVKGLFSCPSTYLPVRGDSTVILQSYGAVKDGNLNGTHVEMGPFIQ